MVRILLIDERRNMECERMEQSEKIPIPLSEIAGYEQMSLSDSAC